jgi:hypothetical protein
VLISAIKRVDSLASRSGSSSRGDLFILCCGFVVRSNIKRTVKRKNIPERLGQTNTFWRGPLRVTRDLVKFPRFVVRLWPHSLKTSQKIIPLGTLLNSLFDLNNVKYIDLEKVIFYIKNELVLAAQPPTRTMMVGGIKMGCCVYRVQRSRCACITCLCTSEVAKLQPSLYVQTVRCKVDVVGWMDKLMPRQGPKGARWSRMSA